MKNVYQRRFSSLPVYQKAEDHVGIKKYSRVSRVIFASTGKGKLVISVNNKDHVVVFNSTANPTVTVELGFYINPDDTLCTTVTNQDNQVVDYYFTLILDDLREEFDEQFTKEMNAELTV